jgi:hypothetical protein
MKPKIASLLAGSAAAFALGYVAASLAPAPAAAPLARSTSDVDVVHAGRRIAAAAFELRTLHAPSPKSAPVLDASAPIAPPEPDVAETFRRDLSAIVWRKGRPNAVIVDASARSGRRVLAIGSVYRDGWKVRAISDSTIELKRRRDVRRIDIFAPPAIDGAVAQDGPLAGDGAQRRILARDALASTQKE